MRKAAIVLNWVMLGLFGIAFLGMGTQYPHAVSGGSLFLLSPYAAALLAFKSKPNRILIGGSIFLNGLILAVGIGYAVLGIVMGEAAKALLAGLILAPSPLLNCVVLRWAWARATYVANQRQQHDST